MKKVNILYELFNFIVWKHIVWSRVHFNHTLIVLESSVITMTTRIQFAHIHLSIIIHTNTFMSSYKYIIIHTNTYSRVRSPCQTPLGCDRRITLLRMYSLCYIPEYDCHVILHRSVIAMSHSLGSGRLPIFQNMIAMSYPSKHDRHVTLLMNVFNHKIIKCTRFISYFQMFILIWYSCISHVNINI